jgi:hypothetical protein
LLQLGIDLFVYFLFVPFAVALAVGVGVVRMTKKDIRCIPTMVQRLQIVMVLEAAFVARHPTYSL